MSITEFLLARIAEDEAVAQETMRRAVADPYTDAAEVTLYSNEAASSGSPIVAATPARILAECEAKRRLVDEHGDYDGFCATCHDYYEHDGIEHPCPTLLALAQPYADHPDYDPAWSLTRD